MRARGGWDRGVRRRVDAIQTLFQLSHSPTGPRRTYSGRGYFETVYHKGAAFYDAMRRRMGPTAFYATLRSLLTTERFGVITHDELFAAFEARTHGTRTVLGRFTNH